MYPLRRSKKSAWSRVGRLGSDLGETAPVGEGICGYGGCGGDGGGDGVDDGGC